MRIISSPKKNYFEYTLTLGTASLGGNQRQVQVSNY